MTKSHLAWPALCFALGLGTPALADEIPAKQLVITKHQFSPAELTVPANTRVKLLIRNDGALPAEFESYDLSREIVLPAHSQVTVYIGPLKPGLYKFFNDFDQSMQGWVVVAPPAK